MGHRPESQFACLSFFGKTSDYFSLPFTHTERTALKKNVSMKGIGKYLKILAWKKNLTMKSRYKYLGHYVSVLHLQRRVRSSVVEWQYQAYFLQLMVSDYQHFRKLQQEHVLIFFEPKTCTNLSCLRSTVICADDLAGDIVSFFDFACTLRTIGFNLLRYMRSLLRVCKFDLDISCCATEISICNDEEMNPVQLKPVQFILGVHCQRKAQHWLLVRCTLSLISISPVHIFPDMRRIWRDRIVTGDLPSQVMKLLARALNDPGEITITEPIPVKALDLEDQCRVDNLEEDCQSNSSEVGCVSDQQEMHDSILCMPDLMEIPAHCQMQNQPSSLNKRWWTGLIDEASKTSRL